MSDAKITWTGDVASLEAAFKKKEEMYEKDIAQLKKAMVENRKFADEEKKHQREAQQGLDKTRTAQEVYNQQVQKWFQLMASGKITLAEFNKLKGEEKRKLDESTAAVQKASAAQMKLGLEQAKGVIQAGQLVKATHASAEGFAFMATKALLAVSAVKALAAEQKRQREEAAGTVANIDDLSRDYAIQGGLKTDDQRKSAVTRIMSVARDNASTPQQAFNTASQLASSGFDAPEGESLDSALKIIKTSDMAKSDPKGYIDAAAKFLKANNQKLTGKNLLEIGVAMRGLVDTPVQASDLAEFAEAAPILNMQGVDWKTGLGMMTELRRGFSGATAGTKMRNIAQRLATASADKQSSEALEEIGLKPEDIDAVGESMPEALKRVGAAVNAQPLEKRAGLMGRIFNNENVAAADVLIKNIDAVEKNVTAMGDQTLFTAGVNFQMQGHNAQVNRAEIDKQNAQLIDEESVTKKSVLLKEVEINRLERQRKQGLIKNVYDTVIQNPKDDLMNQIGAVSDDELLQRSVTGVQVNNGWTSTVQQAASNARLDKSGAVFTGDQLKERLAPDPQAPAMAEQNAILRDIRGAVTNPANRPTVNPTATGRTDR